MNSDTRPTVEEIAKEVGVVVPCSGCGNYDVDAGDSEAEKMLYAQATNLWKDGDRAFRSMSREEVVTLVKTVLTEAPFRCPSCDNPS